MESSSSDPSGVAGVTGEMADLEILEMVGDLLNNDHALTNIADQLMGLDFANNAENQIATDFAGNSSQVMPKEEPEEHQHYNQPQQHFPDQKMQSASIAMPVETQAISPGSTTASVPRTSSGKDMSVMWKSYHSVKEEETDDDEDNEEIDEEESKPPVGAGNLPLLTIGTSASESESAYSPLISHGSLSSPASSTEFIGTSPYSGYISSENDCSSMGRARSEASMSEEGSTATADKPSPTQPCEICNCQASEYKYYGARSCQSCRAFFRRAVQKPGGYQSLKCRAAKKGGAGGAEVGRCRIDSQSWRSCRYCRFQKCLSAGMNPKWVLNDSEKRRRAERLEVIKKEREQRLAKQQMMMVAEPVDLVTREEMSSISNLAMARMGVFAVELKKFFYANYNRLQRFSDTKNGRGPLLLDDLKTFEALFTHLHTKFVEESIDCYDILPGDKKILLKNNCRMWVSLGHSINVEVGGESTIMVGRAIDMASQMFQKHPDMMGNGGYKLIRYNSSGNMTQHNQQQPYNGMLQRRSSLDPEDDDYEYSWPFKQVMMSHKRQPAAGMTYEQFYPPSWVGDQELERKHKENGAKVAAWFEGNPDHIQFFLLSMIIIFSSSFLDLERPCEAERAQLTYARALHRYLRYKMYKAALKQKKLKAASRQSSSLNVDLGAAAKKLGDGMMILTLARETQKIKEMGHGKDYDCFEDYFIGNKFEIPQERQEPKQLQLQQQQNEQQMMMLQQQQQLQFQQHQMQMHQQQQYQQQMYHMQQQQQHQNWVYQHQQIMQDPQPQQMIEHHQQHYLTYQ